MKKTAIFLFLLTFFVYNLKTNTVIKGDTTPARLLPLTLLSGRGIYFDDFRPLFPSRPFFFQEREGHTVSAYPLMPGLVSVPIYLPAYLWLRSRGWDTIPLIYRFSFGLEKISASVFASLSVVLFYLLVVSLTKKRLQSLWWALIFAFATPTFSISSQYLWQHGIATLFLLAGEVSLVWGMQRPAKRRVWFTLAVLWALASLFTRYSFFFFVLGLFGAVYLLDQKYRRWYLVVTLVPLMAFFAYNRFVYGLWLGTQATPATDFTPGSFLEGLVGLLVSPGRGMLFYTPFFIVSLLAIFVAAQFRKADKLYWTLFTLNYGFLWAVILLHAAWRIWWGGWSWGDRYLADAAAPAVFLAFGFWQFVREPLARLVLVVLVGYSILAQVVGVFFYPRGQWDNYPVDVVTRPDRVWDLQDNPITRNILAGPDLAVVYHWYYRWSGYSAVPYGLTDRACRLRLVDQRRVLGVTVARVILANLSNRDWVTQGAYPITLRQLYPLNNQEIFESPVPSWPLPPVIRAGEAVRVSLPLFVPNPAIAQVVISPVQESVAWWSESCQLSLSL